MHRIVSQNGFTLVELAIVMTIIGLLIGGVLKGQELLKNARITSTISQVQAYQAAITTFEDRFHNIPGDMPHATQRLIGCTAANFCVNGDGDGIIGTIAGNNFYDDATGSAVPAVETTMFWKHLALADMISGVIPSADPDAPTWGETHPAAKIGGGFQIVLGTTGTRWLRLQMSVSGTINQPNGGNPLTPGEAAQFDRKMDDGKANSGAAGWIYPGGQSGTGCFPAYDERVTQKNCLLFFKIG